jgi:hypothetical protein
VRLPVVAETSGIVSGIRYQSMTKGGFKMLPNDDKPWAKTLARIVICLTIVALVCLSLFLESRNMFHIPEIVGVFLLFLTIVPPNLAVLYPWILPTSHQDGGHRVTKSTVR